MGDNGYFLGERQLAGKWLMYDRSLRVPMLIYDPRGRDPREVEDMVLNIDVPATILDAAGVAVPEAYQGVSLLGYTRGEAPAADREAFLCEHLWELDEIPSSEGIRTERWKYMRYRFIPGRGGALRSGGRSGGGGQSRLDPAYGRTLRSCAGSATGRSNVTSRCAATDSGRRCSSRKIHAGEQCAAAAVRFFGEIGSECFSGIFLPE